MLSKYFVLKMNYEPPLWVYSPPLICVWAVLYPGNKSCRVNSARIVSSTGKKKKIPVLCCVMGDVLSPCRSPSQIAFFGSLLLMTLLASSLLHAPTFPIILLMHPSTIAYSISYKNAPPPYFFKGK